MLKFKKRIICFVEQLFNFESLNIIFFTFIYLIDMTKKNRNTIRKTQGQNKYVDWRSYALKDVKRPPSSLCEPIQKSKKKFAQI